MIPKDKELKLIAIYLFISNLHDNQLKHTCQRLFYYLQFAVFLKIFEIDIGRTKIQENQEFEIKNPLSKAGFLFYSLLNKLFTLTFVIFP